MQTRAMEEAARRPFALFSMYDQLQHAAAKAGVPKEDLRRQLWNECVQKYIHLYLLIDQPSDSDVIPSLPRRQLLAHLLKLRSQREKRRRVGSNTRPSRWS
jgi:hypothetical protein